MLWALPAQAAAPLYTALGDSYASGVGTRSYYADSTSCNRSPYAYPVLDANQIGASLTFAACSGAKVADVSNNQLGSLSSSTNYVTLTVGGNDAGFSSVITQCANPAAGRQPAPVPHGRQQMKMALAGDGEDAPPVHADDDESGAFVDVQPSAGCPSEGADDHAIGDSAAGVESS